MRGSWKGRNRKIKYKRGVYSIRSDGWRKSFPAKWLLATFYCRILNNLSRTSLQRNTAWLSAPLWKQDKKRSQLTMKTVIAYYKWHKTWPCSRTPRTSWLANTWKRQSSKQQPKNKFSSPKVTPWKTCPGSETTPSQTPPVSLACLPGPTIPHRNSCTRGKAFSS